MSKNENDTDDNVFFDLSKPMVTGHILIRDKLSGKVLINKRDKDVKELQNTPLKNRIQDKND